MCVWGDIFCTRAFLALVSHGMKTGTATATSPCSVWQAWGHYLPCCRRAEGKVSQEAKPMQRHWLSDLPIPPHSPPTAVLLLSRSLFPWKAFFTFSPRAGLQLVLFVSLFNWPVFPSCSFCLVSPSRGLFTLISSPGLALSPDSPEVRAGRSKWVRERQGEQKLTKQWGRRTCIIKKKK